MKQATQRKARNKQNTDETKKLVIVTLPIFSNFRPIEFDRLTRTDITLEMFPLESFKTMHIDILHKFIDSGVDCILTGWIDSDTRDLFVLNKYKVLFYSMPYNKWIARIPNTFMEDCLHIYSLLNSLFHPRDKISKPWMIGKSFYKPEFVNFGPVNKMLSKYIVPCNDELILHLNWVQHQRDESIRRSLLFFWFPFSSRLLVIPNYEPVSVISFYNSVVKAMLSDTPQVSLPADKTGILKLVELGLIRLSGNVQPTNYDRLKNLDSLVLPKFLKSIKLRKPLTPYLQTENADVGLDS